MKYLFLFTIQQINEFQNGAGHIGLSIGILALVILGYAIVPWLAPSENVDLQNRRIKATSYVGLTLLSISAIILFETFYDLQDNYGCLAFEKLQFFSNSIRFCISILLAIIIALLLFISSLDRFNLSIWNDFPIYKPILWSIFIALTIGIGPIAKIEQKDAVTKIYLQDELNQLSQLSKEKDKDLEKIKKSKNDIKSLFTKHKQEIFFYQKDKKLYSLPLNEFLDTLGSIPNHYGKYRFNFDTSLCRIEKLDIYLNENSSVKHEELAPPPSPSVKPTDVTPPIPYPKRKFIYKDFDDRHLPEARDEMEKTVEEKVKELFGYIIHIARKDIPYDNKTKVKQLATELFLPGATIEVVNKQGEIVFRGSPSKYFNRFGSLQYSKIDLIFDYHGIVDKKELSPNQLAFLKSEFGQKFIGYNSDNNIQYEDYTIKRIEIIAHYIETTKSWGVIFNNIKVEKN